MIYPNPDACNKTDGISPNPDDGKRFFAMYSLPDGGFLTEVII
jgi:hypothetical protein